MAVNPADGAVWGVLYGTDAMRGTVGEMALLQRMLDVEAALARAESGLGIVPQAAAEWLQTSGYSAMSIMVLIILIFIVLGCLMDSLSMIILAIPFFWPVVAGLDFGLSENETKIWFGIIILVVVELGLITPPVGLNVFIINAQARDVPMRETFKGVVPFLAADERSKMSGQVLINDAGTRIDSV